MTLESSTYQENRIPAGLVADARFPTVSFQTSKVLGFWLGGSCRCFGFLSRQDMSQT